MGIDMEAEKLLEQNGFSKFYESKNVVGFVSMRDRLKFYEDTLCDGRHLSVKPDVIGDFRNIPFDDETFNMVVFDPPHLIKAGDNSWLVKKYGKLSNAWPQDIKQGFDECMRVLKSNGTLIFKWNEEQIKLKEILNCINYKPLFGNKRSKTHWLVFMK